MGATALASGMLFTICYLVWAARWGKLAEPNPWRSASFEWRTTSPPPVHNFEESPDFERGPYDYTAEAIERERRGRVPSGVGQAQVTHG